jgi:RelA/SpoT family (p)ppGpp synthetase
MPGREELVNRVSRYNPATNQALIGRAYDYAERAHEHQIRKSGEKYFVHPVAVAEILTELKLDDATIATGLLHDTIEDTEATRAEIDRLFGAEIGELVDGVTKLEALDFVTKKTEQAEQFRKLLIAISGDIRVLLVKLADRLHNMRTLQHMSDEGKRRISRETMEIYAPLAGRMGIHWMREELEDLAFRWLYPGAYETVVARLEKLRAVYRSLISEIQRELHLKLQEKGIAAIVTSREKKPFSIWNKMEHRQISLEQLCDIYGFRIITENVEDCYRVLGVIHTTWKIVPGRFKDFVSVPKPNDYRSIHTTIVGPEHQRVELQIRTREMHEVCEYGVAAHTLYKESVATGTENRLPPKDKLLEDSNAYKWLRQLVSMFREGDNPEDFLEHTRLELFQDQVFCFTPNGNLIVLPKGATPIDFAYAVHTDIGNTCVGCKVNGRPMPIMTALKNGDEVEISCTPGQRPPAAWENIAVTGKAKAAIRRATREAVEQQFGKLGRDMIGQGFALAGYEFSEDKLREKRHRLPQGSLEQVYAAVGRGELEVDNVIAALYPDYDKQGTAARRAVHRADGSWLGKAMGLRFRWAGQQNAPLHAAGAIPIRGASGDLPVKFAPKGGALPGERIVGILTPGEGITIYPIHAEALQKFDDHPERWVDVIWDIQPGSQERFPALIAVTTVNAPGSLARIAALIGEAGANIDKLRMVQRAHDYTEMLIGIEVWDIKHLNSILSGLKNLDIVSNARRVHS